MRGPQWRTMDRCRWRTAWAVRWASRAGRVLEWEESLNVLSNLRLGVATGIADSVSYFAIDELQLIAQPAHLQCRLGGTSDEHALNAARADLFRERFVCISASTHQRNCAGTMYALIVHGGAGQWQEERLPRAIEGVERALDVGISILSREGSAVDAVEQAVMVLEDDPVFDAGTGSYANTDGDVEMDAIIDRSTGRFSARWPQFAICAIPFRARKVMEDTPHCLLAGEGASRFAHANGFDFISNELLIGDATHPAHDTVGAVALDIRGRIAVATSTGGTRDKMPGRVGDSPIYGAGAFADEVCGVSATGVGEYIMRVLLAKFVADRSRADYHQNSRRKAESRASQTYRVPVVSFASTAMDALGGITIPSLCPSRMWTDAGNISSAANALSSTSNLRMQLMSCSST